MKTDTPSVIFTWDGIRRGARMCMPLAFASFFGGVGFGILAGDTGLGLFQAMGMSALVFMRCLADGGDGCLDLPALGARPRHRRFRH